MTTYLDQLTERDLAISIWQALRRIEVALATGLTVPDMPPLVVNVPELDLADMVNAVSQLNGTGPTAEEIARALADVLTATPVPAGEALSEVARALEKLDFRLKGVGQSFGGGATSISADAADSLSLAINRGVTDYEARLDYVDRTDDQPVYIGRALTGTATTSAWSVERITYDGSDRPVRKQSLTGAWDDRAALAW